MLCTGFGSLVVRLSCITAVGKGMVGKKALSLETREQDIARLFAQKLAL